MRRVHEEDGAVAVTVALFLVVFFLIVALVVDIGMARFDRHANQTAADLAVTAAVNSLNEDDPDAYKVACEAALAYFLANTADASIPSGSPCDAFADASFSCTDSSAATSVAIDAAPYLFTVTVPVPDGHALMAGQTLNREVDGYDPCGRVGITVRRERENLFAGVAGFGSSFPTSDAVGRVTSDGSAPEYATLVVLDPSGCRVLTGRGGPTKLLIENAQLDTDGDGVPENFPGIITVDSTAAECSPPGNNEYAITPNGSSGRICAGVDPLAVPAILAETVNCITGVNVTEDTLMAEGAPGAVANTEPGEDVDQGRVAPRPIRRGRVTRQPIDHRYNCRGDYGTIASPLYVNANGQRHLPMYEAASTVIGPCGHAGRRGHVDDLVSQLQGMTSTEATTLGWTVISTKEDCAPSATPPARPAGNYYLNCRRTGAGQKTPFTVANGVTFEFQGPSTIVFREGIDVANGGRLRINTSNTADSIVYVQKGGVELGATANPATQAQCDPVAGPAYDTEFYRTFVYVEDGQLNVNGSVCWDAPRSEPYDTVDALGNTVDNPCDDYGDGDVPPAACFQNLGLWTNSRVVQNLGAGGTIYLDGIFFAPNAGADDDRAFKLHGGPGFRLQHAQFFTYRLSLAGGSQLTMRPDPHRFEETPLIGGGLIR